MLRRCLAGMGRNPLIQMVAVGTIALSLVVAGAFALVAVNLARLADHWGRGTRLARRSSSSWSIMARVRDGVTTCVSGFSTVSIVQERFPVKSRLHGGWKGALFNTLFVGTFNALPRAWVRRFGWHLLAFCTK